MNTPALVGSELFIDSAPIGVVWSMKKQAEGMLIEVDGGLAAFLKATVGPHEFTLRPPHAGAPTYKKSMMLLNCHLTKRSSEAATALLYLVPLLQSRMVIGLDIATEEGARLLRKFMENHCDYNEPIKWHDRTVYVMGYSVPGKIEIVLNHETSTVPSPKM